MNNCLFCKIVDGSVPAEVVYRDKSVVAFKDINPQAPVHLIVIPTKHLSGVSDSSVTEGDTLNRLFKVVADLAERNGCEKGYRVVSNCGEDGGQTVPHLHFHLLGKRHLNWPPG
ncbi:MAG: histidine triad nucleotide-binding protein [Candidatus Riflebacteria bacterium]|nr:histidine triad nucleotide-binding protein [Candidatus Riflebacteria bacterium]